MSRELIDLSIEKKEIYGNIRRSIILRLRMLQIIAIFLVIYLIAYPLFRIIQILVNLNEVSNREEPAIFAFVIAIIIITSFLIIQVILGRPHIGSYLFILILILILLQEDNPFYLSFKFSCAIFFYELPIIIHYYTDIFKGYKSYSSTRINEINHLRIALDRHVGFLLTLVSTMIANTWILLFFVDRIKIDLGGEAGVTLPLILIVSTAILVYFRSDVSKFVLKIQGEKNFKM
ncbi:MAG: hypothetical protein ACFFD1_05745 [Candidatus Thorarchaeota archaeon]